MDMFGLSRDSPAREASPDWLHTFQTPSRNVTAISSSSPSSPSHGAAAPPVDKAPEDSPAVFKRKPRGGIASAAFHVVVDVDTDESGDDVGRVFSTSAKTPATEAAQEKKGKADGKASKGSTPKDLKREPGHSAQHQQAKVLKAAANLTKDAEDEDEDHAAVAKTEELLQEGDTVEGQERRTRQVASTLPLLLSDKVHRSKMLLECEGEALDLSGDVGAVGRFSTSRQPEGNPDVLFDLKGVIYKATIVPSNTFFVVNIGQSDAKVEAIMSDFVQLQPNTNIFEAETMVEGTLEGFAFDSDDDGEAVATAADRKKGVENEDVESPLKKKAKTSKVLKPSKGTGKKTLKSGSSKISVKAGSSRKSKLAGKSLKKAATSKKTKPSRK